MDDLEVGAVQPDGDGFRVAARASAHLCGPPGVVQGGLSTALLARAVEAATAARATRVRARLHRPTPTATALVATVQPLDEEPDLPGVAGATGAWAVHTSTTAVDGTPAGDLLVSGDVVVGGRPDHGDGHDDLVAVAGREPLPRAQAVPAAPDCVVCGARNPHGLHLFPGWFPDGAVAEAWEADRAEAGPGGAFVRPAVLAAVLDCPTVWAGRDHCRAHGLGGALLGGFDVTWHSRLPVGEPVRVVARLDEADGRKMFARAGVVGRDGLLYAVARALQVGVVAMPGADPDLDPFGDDLDDDVGDDLDPFGDDLDDD